MDDDRMVPKGEEVEREAKGEEAEMSETGKLRPDDEGELVKGMEISHSLDRKYLVIDFPPSLTWIAMLKEDVKALIAILQKHHDQMEENEE
jgi:hypothetical protein